MMQTKNFVLSVVCFCSWIGSTGAVASYVRAICDRNPIHTTAPKSSGDNGFKISFEGMLPQDKFRPGELYTVVVNGSSEDQTMLGVIVTATVKGANHSQDIGSFDVKMNGQVYDLQEEKICEHHVIAHRYLVQKEGVRFTWVAPKTLTASCIEFRATVIEQSDVWYKDEGGLTKEICQELTQQDEAGMVRADDDKVGVDLPDHNVMMPGEEDECCACGHAMYTVTFEGLWSRHTHPKHFPKAKYAYLLHWSNIVGSTHSNDYRIWQYDHYASRAVKEVCEFGSSRSLENEMKDHSEKIRTVIKTKSLWGPQNILGSVKAVYTVNKKKHLLSLLTMIGPSPDWCLGVSALSMCNSNCTWADNMEIDLYPWDAGTDSGITYMARNQPSDPPEKIHRLTSSYPNNRASPFYGQSLKPMARLVISKNKEACGSDSGEDPSSHSTGPSTEELVSMMKQKMMMKKKLEMEKCSVSEWAEWEECSNDCGSGMRTRQRMLKTPGILESMCNVELMEKEPCEGDCTAGSRKKIADDFIMRHDPERDPNDLCAVTGWSDWSPCSQTCGLGMKERWRMFISKSNETENCGIHLMEKDLCRSEIMDCRKAILMKDFNAICQMEPDVGPCSGTFPRWFYSANMRKCQLFDYGGCRGNDNRFDTEEECMELCNLDKNAMMERQAKVEKEVMMEKQAMMEKQRQMEKQAMMEKQRQMEKQAMMEKQRQMEKQAMMEKQRQMEKQAMMEKQQQMGGEENVDEGDAQQKAIMMQKQQLMDLGQALNADDIKTAIMKIDSMMAQTQTLNISPKAKVMMMREQKRMARKLRRKQKRMVKKGQGRSRRRRRQRKQHDGPSVDCMVTPWSDWSPCSVTCGKGTITRSRMVKRQAENGGRRCPRRLMKTKKCRVSAKCPIDCEMGNWSEWSPCSQSCGDKAVQTRKRKRTRKPKYGGLACPAKKEKRFCSLPLCPDADKEEKTFNYFMMFHRRY